MSKVEYECQEPFDIDNGELDSFSRQECFTFGVEWGMLREELDTGRAVQRTIHAANSERFQKMCERRGREFRLEKIEGYDEWINATVEAM